MANARSLNNSFNLDALNEMAKSYNVPEKDINNVMRILVEASDIIHRKKTNVAIIQEMVEELTDESYKLLMDNLESYQKQHNKSDEDKYKSTGKIKRRIQTRYEQVKKDRMAINNAEKYIFLAERVLLKKELFMLSKDNPKNFKAKVSSDDRADVKKISEKMELAFTKDADLLQKNMSFDSVKGKRNTRKVEMVARLSKDFFTILEGEDARLLAQFLARHRNILTVIQDNIAALEQIHFKDRKLSGSMSDSNSNSNSDSDSGSGSEIDEAMPELEALESDTPQAKADFIKAEPSVKNSRRQILASTHREKSKENQSDEKVNVSLPVTRSRR